MATTINSPNRFRFVVNKQLGDAQLPAFPKILSDLKQVFLIVVGMMLYHILSILNRDFQNSQTVKLALAFTYFGPKPLKTTMNYCCEMEM